jgi:DinB superfamily
MKPIVLMLAGLAVMPGASFGQNSQASKSPVSDAVRSIVERSSKTMVAAADEMPADKYSYHPTPAQMTFGHLVVHMAGSNNFLCSKISGVPAPTAEKLADTDPKDKLVSALKASFDFCSQTLAKVDDSNLGEQLTLFGGRTTTRAGAMIALTNDFADHYSMAAIYLRLNDLLPPTAQKKD